MGSLEGQFDTKLHEAVRYGDLDEVRVALQQGYDPNLIGLYQWSALHEAAHNGETEIIQLLLKKKGDPNKADYLQSKTAMHYASEKGHVECLQLLVNAGGRYDITDSSGKNCLEMATPGGRKILEKLAVRDIMLTKGDDNDTSIVSDEGIVADRSHDQMSILSSRRSSVDSLQDKGPVLGYLHLSVEYHSAKSTLKIRVWQLSDLLLPPPSTSMIHSIYVKSYLQPDKKKDSKRKTEEVKVDTSEGHVHWRRKKAVSIQHVFTPATFKFSRPLEYTGMTSDLVRTKSVEIEVCITQRYSHRSFLIGMVRMPLKAAVRKLVKEKLPLIPCMNHTLPSNMKVYSSSELNVMNNTPGGDIFFSNPNVRIVLPEDAEDTSNKAASNPDLQRQNQRNSQSTEVDMDSQYKYVQEVPVPKLDLGSLTLDESGYSSEFHVSVPSELELESPDSGNSSIGMASSASHFSPVKVPKVAHSSALNVEETILEGVEEHKLAEVSKKNKKKKQQDSTIEITDLDGDILETVTIQSRKKNQQKDSKQPQDSTIEITDLDGDNLETVTIQSTERSVQRHTAGSVIVEGEFDNEEKECDIIIAQSNDVIDNQKKSLFLNLSPKVPGRGDSALSDVTVESNAHMKNNSKSNSKESMKKKSKLEKKSEKLEWDYSDIPIEVVTQEIESPMTPWKEGAAPVILPMETHMGIQESQEIKLAKSDEREKVIRRSRKKLTYPVPGVAVPVPSIVVTSPQKERAGVGPQSPQTKTLHKTSPSTPEADHVPDVRVVDSKPKSDKENKIDIPEEVTCTAESDLGNADQTRPKKSTVKSVLRKIDRKAFVNVGKAMHNDKENVENNTTTQAINSDQTKVENDREQSIAKAKSKLKHFRRSKERGLSKDQMIHFDKDVSKIKDSNSDSDGSNLTGSAVIKHKQERRIPPKPVSLQAGSRVSQTGSRTVTGTSRSSQPVNIDQTGSSFSQTGSRTIIGTSRSSQPVCNSEQTGSQSFNKTQTGSSVVLDMERFGFQSSGAHVIELIEEDISITELAEDDDDALLFTDRSEAPSLGTLGASMSDVESGLSDYKLPVCASPTKYMIPMQVYDVDDTSCDESMSVDDFNRLPTTEL